MEQIAKRRSEDMLVYLALGGSGNAHHSRLPISLQRDIKSFFGT